MVSTYLGRCGDSWVAEGAEISFLPLGDIGYLYTFLLDFMWNQTEGNGADQAGTRSVLQITQSSQISFS
jgi:hypothetical protein